MTQRSTNLALAAIAIIILLGLAWPLLPQSSAPTVEGGQANPTSTSSEVPALSPAADDPALAPSPPEDRSVLRTYAVVLTELNGFPSDAAPGTRVDLWVAWEPPVTRQVKVHRLLRDVVVDRIVAPSTPAGSPAVLLAVDEENISDLIWADRYGSLSATIVPTTP